MNTHSESLASRRATIAGALFLAAIVLVEVFYAIHLQHILYRESGPFNDSVVYYNDLADVWAAAQSRGVWEALRTGWRSATIFLPWLEAAVVAPMLPLSRTAGVWLQAIWVMTLAVSLYCFLVRWRHAPPAIAVCLTLPWIAFRVVFEGNGGLSDFRMDLSLYLFTGLASLWYIAASESPRRAYWLLSGFFAALACLSRGTAPVYLAVMLVPLIAARLYFRRAGRREMLTGLAWMSIPLVTIAVPYLLAKREVLVKYYMVVSEDATAGLPISQSIHHFFFVGQQLGLAMAVPLVAVCLTGIGLTIRRHHWGASEVLSAIDWRAVWLGIAPAAFLALHGAGPNPHVSMPSVFGTLLFLLVPFGAKSNLRGSFPIVAGAVALAASLATAATGPANHRRPRLGIPSMAALRESIDLIRDDALRRGRREASYFTGGLAGFHGPVLCHIVAFDYHGVFGRGWAVDPNGFRFIESGPEGAEYVFLPDDATIARRAKDSRAAGLRRSTDAILSAGNWERIGRPLTFDPEVVLLLYRRVPQTDRPPSPQ